MPTVRIEPYRRVLVLPGVRALLVLMFLARIPTTAAGFVLTLHIVLTLNRSYGAAGLVSAVATVGLAVGSPLLGRVVDVFGLRPMLVLTTAGETIFWVSAWALPYPVLLGVVLFGGALAIPAMQVGRQALAALVPVDLRRTAYSVDSILVEITYMAGPALGVLVATQLSTTTAMIGMGAAVTMAGMALYAVNPSTRADHEAIADGPSPQRTWLGPAMFRALISGVGALAVLMGTEVTVVAALRETGQIGWTGVVTIVICVASAFGGAIYGGLRRSVSPAALTMLMSLLVIPVGLFGGSQWWILAVVLIPTNLLCAPTLTSINDTISRIAPPSVRGEAIGWGASAFTVGAAIGAPLMGVVVDGAGPGWGFVAAGFGGILFAAMAGALNRMDRWYRRDPISPAPQPMDHAGIGSQADAR